MEINTPQAKQLVGTAALFVKQSERIIGFEVTTQVSSLRIFVNQSIKTFIKRNILAWIRLIAYYVSP